MVPGFPLVIPEVNMDDVTPETRHICNPNCSTIQMAVALAPLHRVSRLHRVVVSTYQSVSGWGASAMEELLKQTGNILAGKEPGYDPSIFTHPIAFNCIPQVDKFLAGGYNKEEMKMVNENRKILNEPNLLISATTVRVPVLIGHGESINAEFFNDMTAEKAMKILGDKSQSPGVVLMDGISDSQDAFNFRQDKLERRYPVTGDLISEEYRDAVLVGRVRDDTTRANTINLWCVSDNLRKGAATNAVQIAEEMLKRGLL
jgi:aspartate-semialdehyde dehydrogenase